MESATKKSNKQMLWIIKKHVYVYIYVTLEHKTSHKLHGYICSNSQQYTVWVKITSKLSWLNTVLKMKSAFSFYAMQHKIQ